MSPTKEKALIALMSAKTRSEAAELAGISRRTLQDYFKDPEFKKRHDEMCEMMLDEAAMRARQYMTGAVETLGDIALNKCENTVNRIQAAKAVIEHGLKLVEVTHTDDRLKELEETLDKLTGGDNNA